MRGMWHVPHRHDHLPVLWRVPSSGNGIDFGDYSGLSFYGGLAHPAWSDNSNSTGSNPDGALHQLDIYTASVGIS